MTKITMTANKGQTHVQRAVYDATRLFFIDQSDASAQYLIGYIYSKGRDVKKDGAEATKWLRKAAEQGHRKAQVHLGMMYRLGYSGIPKNYAEAAKWLRKAAEQGDAKGQYNLALLYARGQGVDKDEEAFVEWTLKAAEQGYASAQACLAEMYYTGEDVPQDSTGSREGQRRTR